MTRRRKPGVPDASTKPKKARVGAAKPGAAKPASASAPPSKPRAAFAVGRWRDELFERANAGLESLRARMAEPVRGAKKGNDAALRVITRLQIDMKTMLEES